MSAYMVDREHIRYLVNAAMSSTSIDWERAAQLGEILWAENRASIEFRYPDCVNNPDNLPGPIDEDFVYASHEPTRVPMEPVQILKACDCYEYQACEHPGWASSEAKAFIDALRKRTWQALPGYDEAEWGAPAPAESEVAS